MYLELLYVVMNTHPDLSEIDPAVMKTCLEQLRKENSIIARFPAGFCIQLHYMLVEKDYYTGIPDPTALLMLQRVVQNLLLMPSG